MERITPVNTDSWTQYKRISAKLTNYNRGIIPVLIFQVEEEPSFEEVKEVTGFTCQEYTIFMNKAMKLKGKVERIIESTSIGSNFMETSYCSAITDYIAYITTDITKITLFPSEDMTLKEYITFYKDILITVGSDFTNDISYHNRDIFRNPHWLFQGKYNCLSMWLHGFTGVVANIYYPDKKYMEVVPVGSMQCLLKKYLLRDEVYIKRYSGKGVDIKDVNVTPTSPQNNRFQIKISALLRIIKMIEQI